MMVSATPMKMAKNTIWSISGGSEDMPVNMFLGTILTRVSERVGFLTACDLALGRLTVALEERLLSLLAQAFSGLQCVGQREAYGGADDGIERVERDGAEADASHPSDITQALCAHNERGKYERDDDHENQADEDRTERRDDADFRADEHSSDGAQWKADEYSRG